MAYPAPGRCPVCRDIVEVTRLHCPSCDTTIEGHFSLGGFGRLTQEQLAFAETFIRCEGKINRVEEELDISYPTVRNRLHELIRAMGYEVRDEPTASLDDRMAVLEELSAGSITPDEALKRLKGR